MRLQYDKKLWLKSDSSQYVVFQIMQVMNNKLGEKIDQDINLAYYADLSKALRFCAEYNIKKSSVVSLKGLASIIDKEYKKLDEVVEKLKYKRK